MEQVEILEFIMQLNKTSCFMTCWD